MDVLSRAKVARIRELNDNFRNSFRGGKILLTQSVAELPDMVKAAALCKVATFKDFNEANGENDFLKFELCNRSFVFIISYYDLKMEHGSPDPSDPNVAVRIGTLMQSHDW
jgi:hypothetical protein